MPRPALTEEQRRQTRQKLRAAAAQLFQQKGISDISARAIAQQAGVSVGTLYSYFDNLTELMQSLWKEPVLRLIEDLEKQLADQSHPQDQLRLLMQRYADFAQRRRGIYRGAFMYVRPEHHEQPSPVTIAEDRFANLFRRAIIAGQKQRVIRAGDPDAIVQTLWSGIHGAITLPINLDRIAFDQSQAPVEQMIELLLDWAFE